MTNVSTVCSLCLDAPGIDVQPGESWIGPPASVCDGCASEALGLPDAATFRTLRCLRCEQVPESLAWALEGQYHEDWDGQGNAEWLCGGCADVMFGPG